MFIINKKKITNCQNKYAGENGDESNCCPLSHSSVCVIITQSILVLVFRLYNNQGFFFNLQEECKSVNCKIIHLTKLASLRHGYYVMESHLDCFPDYG